MKNLRKSVFLAYMVIFFQVSCKKDIVQPGPSPPPPITTIGSNYAGGIVFYVDGTGQHGLVCAPSDQGHFQWGCSGRDIGETSNALGTGQWNTALILGCSQRPIAASVCNDLVLNGYSDWYLPSLGELLLMYSNLRNQGIGGFSSYWYWSSSQYNFGTAWVKDFSDGAGANSGKSSYSQVRAVRTF